MCMICNTPPLQKPHN